MPADPPREGGTATHDHPHEHGQGDRGHEHGHEDRSHEHGHGHEGN